MDHDRQVVNRGQRVGGLEGEIFLEIESFFRRQWPAAKSSETPGFQWAPLDAEPAKMPSPLFFGEPGGREMCLRWQRRNVAFEAFEFSSGLIAESSGSVQATVCVIFLAWKFQQNWPIA